MTFKCIGRCYKIQQAFVFDCYNGMCECSSLLIYMHNNLPVYTVVVNIFKLGMHLMHTHYLETKL